MEPMITALIISFALFASALVALCFSLSLQHPKTDPESVRAPDIESSTRPLRKQNEDSTLRRRRVSDTTVKNHSATSRPKHDHHAPTPAAEMFAVPIAKPKWRTEKTIQEEKDLEKEATLLWENFVAATEVEDKYRCTQKIAERFALIKNTHRHWDPAVFVTQQIVFCNVLMQFNGLNMLQESKGLGHKSLTALATGLIEDVVPVIWSS
eukprot:GEMP01040917.1.p1 GENE.GEMP01040917.1~~GEMP01040917.1.p1  ORF type:complete len:209 (+),score=38.25 GEMP01040917.1:84-710(+)